jgi:hypothetical protein
MIITYSDNKKVTMDMKNIDGGNMMIKEIRIPIFDALTPYIYFNDLIKRLRDGDEIKEVRFLMDDEALLRLKRFNDEHLSIQKSSVVYENQENEILSKLPVIKFDDIPLVLDNDFKPSLLYYILDKLPRYFTLEIK